MAPSIDVLMNAREVQRGAKDVVAALEGVADAADDVAREGEQGADKLERGLRDIVQAARPAEKAVKDVGDAADKAGDDAKRGMKKAAEGTSEFKDEAKQSAREGAASFSGEFDDVSDYVQEVLANALGGFGPLGAAAGIAAAVGIGVAMSQAVAAQEKINEAREAGADLASEMYENGGPLPLTGRVNELLQLLARESRGSGALGNMIDGWTDFGTVLEDIQRVAARTGDPVERLVSALNGDDLELTRRTLQRVQEELDGLSGWTPVWDEQKRSLTSYRDELDRAVKLQEIAKESLESTGALDTKRVDDLAAAWNNAGVQAGNYFKAGEDGIKTFDVAAYIADWEEQIAKADEVKADLLTLPESIKDEAERQWAAGGVAAADAYVDAYQAADADTKAKLEAIAGPQGQTAGQKAAQGFVDAANSRFTGYTLPELNGKLRLTVDDSAWRLWRPGDKIGNVRTAVGPGGAGGSTWY